MRYSLLLFFVIFIVSCMSSEKKTWPDKMQNLGESLSEVLPLLFDDEAFKDPEKKEKVLEKLKALKASSHDVKGENAKKILGKDPIVGYSLKGLKGNIQDAIHFYEEGEIDLSQRMLKRSISYCYYCHTRSNFGPQFESDHFKIDISKMDKPLERAQLLVATRQYERAKADLKYHLFSGQVKTQYQDLRMVKLYLQIAIKSGTKEQVILNDLALYEKSHKLPVFMNDVFQNWKNSLKNWRIWQGKEKLIEKKIANMRKDTSKVGLDSYFIDSIYISNFLHNKLMSDSADRAEIYYQLGWIYNRFPELQLWELSEVYYTNCIVEEPKSRIAKKCYRDLEESIYLGYTGSAGTYIPESQKLRLKLLKEKAGL